MSSHHCYPRTCFAKQDEALVAGSATAALSNRCVASIRDGLPHEV